MPVPACWISVALVLLLLLAAVPARAVEAPLSRASFNRALAEGASCRRLDEVEPYVAGGLRGETVSRRAGCGGPLAESAGGEDGVGVGGDACDLGTQPISGGGVDFVFPGAEFRRP